MTELIWDGKYDKDGRRVAPLRVALPFQTVETVNESAQQRQRMLDLFSAGRDPDWRNRLIWGDKKYVLPALLDEFAGQVNLIYIDPPFNVGADFSFTATVPEDPEADNGGTATFVKEPSAIELKAYRDTWGRGLDSYLHWFYETAVLLRELLAEDGSVYVHLDWHVGHYAKVVMDEVFGYNNIESQIIWQRVTGHMDTQSFGFNHDMILHYGKSTRIVWNRQFAGYDESYLRTHYRYVDPDGRRYELDQISAAGQGPAKYFFGKLLEPPPGTHWRYSQERIDELCKEGRIVVTSGGRPRYKRYLDEQPGKAVQSIWTDISPVNSQAQEDTRYATQKPEALLERIIRASSNEGDLVLDCFCVRKGTAVLTPLNPPARGGTKTPSPYAGRAGVGQSPSLQAGRAGVGQSPSPYAGRAGVGQTPIEQLHPGDWVFAHDGQPHRVLRVHQRRYHGEMIGIRHNCSDATLWLTPDHRVLCARRVQKLSEHGGWSAVPQHHFERARELRREMTPPERKLWQVLRGEQMGVKFRRQHPIGPYIADFYAREAGLVVEVDGTVAHGAVTTVEYDRARDEYMQQLGLQVLRFTASDVDRRLPAVAQAIYQACAEHVLGEQPDKQWVYARHLKVGDAVYVGVELQPCEIVSLECCHVEEDVYDLEVEAAHSYITAVCAVHNCGSGTTAAVAEKLGRRWVACDLSRFAIHTTRKRLLSIDNVRPFVVQNLGKYERQAWQAAEFTPPSPPASGGESPSPLMRGETEGGIHRAYRRFILDLYHARPISGYTWLHGVRHRRMVHVGAVDAPISTGDVTNMVTEFKRAVGSGADAPATNGIDILGWDFAFELNEVAKQQAAQARVDLRFLRIPRDVMDKRAVEQGDIQFFELAALAVEVKTNKRSVTLTLTDFVIPPDDVPQDVQRAITHWSQWIDYWAVDWDNKGDTFHNEWQTYRTRKNREMQRSVTHTYDAPGEYTVVVKVIDILGNDTTKTLKVRV